MASWSISTRARTISEDAPARCRLYILTPAAIPDLDAFSRLVEQTLDAGDVACFQLRLKSASDDAIRTATQKLMPIVQARNVAFILNDRPDLAAKLGCDGVHIGPEDMSYRDARGLVGPAAIVGVSAKGSRHDAMDAAEAGADYVAFGAFFPTATKDVPDPISPEIIEVWSETTTVPCVAIGGITVENCDPLIDAGADFLAVSSGIWNHPDGPAAAVAAFNKKLDRS